MCRELSGWCWEHYALCCKAEQGLWWGTGSFPVSPPGNVPQTLLSMGTQKCHWHPLIKGKMDTAEGRARVLEPTVPTRGLSPSWGICKRRFPLSPEAEGRQRAHSELCPWGFLKGDFITTEFTKDSQPQGPLRECYTANSSLTTWKLRDVSWGINILINKEILYSTGNAVQYSVIM